MYMLAHMDTVTAEFDTLWDKCECYSPFLQHITYKDLVEAAGGHLPQGRTWISLCFRCIIHMPKCLLQRCGSGASYLHIGQHWHISTMGSATGQS